MAKSDSASPPKPRRRPDSHRVAVAICCDADGRRAQIEKTLRIGGHSVVGSAPGPDEVIGQVGDDRSVDCVVVATRRANRPATELLTQLAQRLSSPGTVLSCERAGDREVGLALQRGVDGIVLLAEVDRALAAVVSAVCCGQICAPRTSREEMREDVLSSRERQILGLVVMGLTNAEIARRLYLAESTVKSHLSSAFAKLNVASRHEAVRVILDPERGRGLGILTIPAEPLPA